ncbi:MAG: hypothetical protein JKY56_24710 [Kofleriaceae bacterium]|nr:hypothetical protein [Kofleriaceae bacterium]
MSSLNRCPQCDTFVKAESLGGGSCPFCVSALAAAVRNPIKGAVLAATIVSASACLVTPIYGTPVDDASTTDASAVDASAVDGSVDADGSVSDAATDGVSDAAK